MEKQKSSINMKSKENPKVSIKELREKLNLSPEELAAQIGFSPDFIRKIERGERSPSKKFIASLSLATPKPRAPSLEEMLKRANEESSCRHDLRYWHGLLEKLLTYPDSGVRSAIKESLAVYARLCRITAPDTQKSRA